MYCIDALQYSSYEYSANGVVLIFPHKVVAVQSTHDYDDRAIVYTEGGHTFTVNASAIDVINEIQSHLAHCGEDLTMQMID